MCLTSSIRYDKGGREGEIMGREELYAVLIGAGNIHKRNAEAKQKCV